MLPVLDGSKEPNPILQWLEKALLAVFPYSMLILVLVLAVYLCRRLFLFLRRWTRERAQALEGAPLADYVDQVEDVRDSRQTLRIRRVHRDRGGENDPRQRVRAAFRRLQKRHGEWTPSRTARACLNDTDMASIYEKARYSSHDVTGEEAGKFSAFAEQKNSRGPT